MSGFALSEGPKPTVSMSGKTGGRKLISVLSPQKWRKLVMRGDNTFVSFGALYIKSGSTSGILAAQITEAIPNAPGGDAFLRWGKKPHDGSRIGVLITGVGRMGNSIIQTLNALMIARALHSDTVLYHLFASIGNHDLILDSRITARKTRLRWSGKQRHPDVIWRTYAMTPAGMLSDPCVPELETARLSLGEHLAPDAIGPEHPGQDRALTVYLRSGDVFAARPEKNYAQPPWAFYEKILALEKWETVRLVSEDGTNPVHGQIVNWCAARGVELVQLGSDLAETVAEIARSKFLVNARGTFLPAILFLSQAKRTVFQFHEQPSSLLCRKDTSFFSVYDTNGEYVSALMSKNWKNTKYQRDLMVTYPASYLSDVTEGSSSQ